MKKECRDCPIQCSKGNKSISIPFSEEDLQRLINGETFDWNFDGVEVHLYQGEEDEDEC